ncbi:hypothetical protein PsYK624_139410 [Phanerochaete sordida]|uniref:Uncharacterized protein n=1 Tax=Phanerochaete sordida TaxID=48140 RepID=A0A9P3LJU6_9APHY|nr:hypothetical protein PsYK624_139410 [Phanerochaete sordida]
MAFGSSEVKKPLLLALVTDKQPASTPSIARTQRSYPARAIQPSQKLSRLMTFHTCLSGTPVRQCGA